MSLRVTVRDLCSSKRPLGHLSAEAVRRRFIRAAWALPVAVTPPAQLGTAATAGLLVLVLGSRLARRLAGLDRRSANLDSVFLECAGGVLALLARIGNTRQLGIDIDLWSNASPSTSRSAIDVTFPNNTLIYYTSISSFAGVSQVEIVSSGCSDLPPISIARWPRTAAGSGRACRARWQFTRPLRSTVC